MNIVAGKLVGQLSTAYENLQIVKQQADVMIQTSQPILKIVVVSPITGDTGSVANTVALLLTTEMQATLDAAFAAKLATQLTTINTSFNTQVAVATNTQSNSGGSTS